jgi:hypothetical protein
MYKKPFFTLKNFWIWILINIFAVGVVFVANYYNDPAALKVLIADIVVATIALISSWYTINTYINIKKWNDALKTKQNLGVFSEPGFTIKLDYINSLISDRVLLWCMKYKRPYCDIINYMEGGSITFTSKEIYVKYAGKVNGYTDGNKIELQILPESIQSKDETYKLLSHEIDHMCLNALGIDPGSAGVKHHEIMKGNESC